MGLWTPPETFKSLLMSWSTNEAFTDPAIRRPMSFRSEFKFFLKDIPVEITVRLFNPIHSEDIVVEQSHTISVPGAGPVEESVCADETQEGEVVQAVVRRFVSSYNAAIAQGMKPDASWLKLDTNFR